MDATEVRQVFGLRNFLRDFTLISDRGVVEVKLWSYYLVFATLFGIADQVYKDFRKVCPEYFELARKQFSQEADFSPVIIWSTINDSSRWMSRSAMEYASGGSGDQQRWSGGGGMTSFGGGGGFSGGGFGGGGR